MKNTFEKKRKERLRKERRRGFTLVELIVVMALLGILLSFSAGALIGYTKYASFKRNNESARALFNAAQSALTYYKASGQLEDLKEQVFELDETPGFVPAEAFADEGTDAVKRKTDTISYLMFTKKDYDQVSAGITAGQGGKLFELLRDYVTDASVYQASICLEFDAVDGVVSGVLYSDRADSFSYTNDAGSMNILDRGEDHRKDIGLGYYSTALGERAPQEEKTLELQEALLKNAESLDVQWFLKKDQQYRKTETGYTLEFYENVKQESGAFQKRKVMEVTLDQEQIAALTVEGGAHAYLDAKEVRLFADTETDSITLTPDAPYEGGTVPAVRFHACLVQDDEGDLGGGIALSLDVIDSYAAEAYDSTEPDKELLDTYSARRFSAEKDGKHYGFDLAAQRTIDAEVSITAATSRKSTGTGNLLFGNASAEDGEKEGFVYEIANARHLYNVRFTELDREAGASADPVVYEVTQDFAWGGPQGLLSFTAKTPWGGAEDSTAQPGGDCTKFFHKMLNYSSVTGEDARYPALPSIRTLRENSTLRSKAAEAAPGEGAEESPDVFTIGYLALEPEASKEAEGSLEPNVGLVQHNLGTIENLKLEHVDVRGIVRQYAEGETAEETSGPAAYASAENVGAFCGRNEGTLTNVETVSGYVTGGKNVGGIAGVYSKIDAEIETLHNGAEVSGIENVGGILGSISDEQEIKECENTGLVYGWVLPEDSTLDGEDKASARNIGGITGMAGDSASVSQCSSIPQKQTDGGETAAAELSAEEIRARLHGTCVGGIAGYLEGEASVESCTAGAEDASSYVLGEYFVGGIVGLNGGEGRITANAEPELNTNKADVYGVRFVGGIIGVNGGLKAESMTTFLTAPEKITHQDFDTDMESFLAFWISGGTVSAVDIQTGVPEEGDAASGGSASGEDTPEEADARIRPAYVGGIAGANIGTLSNCTVSGGEADTPAGLEPARADYVGGIAGYNAGEISAAPAQTVDVQLEGRNFVGGLVGYNDGAPGWEAGKLRGYSMAETAAVTGDNFVGGFVGVNTANALIADNTPENAEGEAAALYLFDGRAASAAGRSFVGGFAGANITQMYGTEEKPKTEMQTARGIGAAEVRGDAFVGGLFGYSRIAKAEEARRLLEEDGVITALLSASGQSENASGQERVPMDAETLAGLAEAVLEMDPNVAQGTEQAVGLVISQQKAEASEEAQPQKVEGQLFVGGVIGYHAANGSLTIQDYTVDGDVTASSAISYSGFDEKYGAGKTYSFSGGIVGYTALNTTLRGCRMLGTVTAGGTYLGGLTEVNEGRILSCAAASVGAADRSYVGGIAGVNGYTMTDIGGTPTRTAGEIRSCVVPQGAVVSGAGCTGGMTAENYGAICAAALVTDPDAGALNGGGTVSAAGMYIGGLAGVNRPDGLIENVTSLYVIVNAPAAHNVGGMAGLNEGRILGGGVNADTKVTGADRTGGIAGRNSGSIGAYIRVVTGEDTISENCVSLAQVTATGGIAGGIAGENRAEAGKMATITDAVTGAQSAAGQQISAAGAAGGIAGENGGEISGCRVLGAAIAASAAGAGAGGIAGENAGEIFIADAPLEAVKIVPAADLYIGGIAGKNLAGGQILGVTSKDVNEQTILPKVSADLADRADAACDIGGIAGLNEGAIQELVFAGTIDGHATLSEKEQKESAKPKAYGGIAAIHTGDGTITDCTLGAADAGTGEEKKSVALSAEGRNYLGGIVGRAEGKAQIETAEPDRSAVQIASKGALATGGVAALTAEHAKVANAAAGEQWAILAENLETEEEKENGKKEKVLIKAGPVGGVIGVHTSEEELKGLKNYAGTFEAESGAASGSGEKAKKGVFTQGDVAGGIIGSMELENGAFTAQDLHNYGPVTAGRTAGGVLGEWNSPADGSITESTNGAPGEGSEFAVKDPGDPNAAISVQKVQQKAEKDSGETEDPICSAAGIVGGFASMDAGQEIELTSCENFGIVESVPGAGIAAVTEDTGEWYSEELLTEEAEITFKDCVNAGMTAQGAGIVLFYGERGRGISLTVNRCRNYGRPQEEQEESFAGIFAEAVKTETGDWGFAEAYQGLSPYQVSIQNSVGAAAVKYPIAVEAEETEEAAPAVEGEENYYYSFLEDGGLKMLSGIGAATDPLTGYYLTAEDEELSTDRTYLKAINLKSSSSETPFDPNQESTEESANYKADSRGNYHRLDGVLKTACEQLEKESNTEADEVLPITSLTVEQEEGKLKIAWTNGSADESAQSGADGSTEGSTGEGTEGGADGSTEGGTEGGADGNTEGGADEGASDDGEQIAQGTVDHAVVQLYLYEEEPKEEEDGGETGGDSVTESTDPDAGAGTPQEGTDGETGAEAGGTLVLTKQVDAGTQELSVEIENVWIDKWIKVVVTNYTADGTASEPCSQSVQILEQAASPELETQLAHMTAGGDPVYALAWLNREEYANGILQMTVTAEPEEGQGGGSWELQLSSATDDSLLLTPDSLTARDPQGREGGWKDGDVQLTLTDVQAVPSETAAVNNILFEEDGAALQEEEAAQYAPSDKSTYELTLPGADSLRNDFIKQENAQLSEENSAIVLDQAADAVYRAEIVQKKQIGDTMWQNLTVASVSSPIRGTGTLPLAGLAQAAREGAQVRLYPAEAQDGMLKFGGYAAEHLSEAELLASEYVTVEGPGAPKGTEAVTIGLDAMMQSAAFGEEPQAETLTDEMEDGDVQVEALPDEAADGDVQDDETQSAAEGGAQTEEETRPEVLRSVIVNDGYAVEQNADGTYNVYACALLDSASEGGVLRWELQPEITEQPETESEPESETETETVSEPESETETETASEPESETETETASEPESETETETVSELESESETETASETESESETETASESESESETETASETELQLAPPAGAVLAPDWSDTVGQDEEGEDREPITEEEFKKGLILTAGEAQTPGIYLMRAGFYGQKPEGGGAPDAAYLLRDIEQCDSETALQMEGRTFTFADLPADYVGRYLCVQLALASQDGQSMSEWSDYLWFRLPKVRLEMPEVSLESWTLEHEVDAAGANGETYEADSAQLAHPMLTWNWNAEEKEVIDTGYQLSVYTLLSPDTKEDSGEYQKPDLTFDLTIDDSEKERAFYLERALTAKEKKEWKEEHPKEEMPKTLHCTFQIEEDKEEYKKVHRKNDKLLKIYTMNLDETVLGTADYTYTYTQTAELQGTRTIADVSAQIQIYEYEKNRIVVRLILPDVEQADTFLYDYTGISHTYSITAEPLRESSFTEKRGNENLSAYRTQLVRLIRTETWGRDGQEDMIFYLRRLDETEKFDEPFDFEGSKLPEAKKYQLLPRNYTECFASQTGDAAYISQMLLQEQQMMSEIAAQNEYETEDGVMQGDNGDVFFEDPGEVFAGDGGASAAPENDGVMLEPETPDIGISTELQTETQQMEWQTEPQTQPMELQTAPQQVQTQTDTEPFAQGEMILQVQEVSETAAMVQAETEVASSGQSRKYTEASVGLGALDGRY